MFYPPVPGPLPAATFVARCVDMRFRSPHLVQGCRNVLHTEVDFIHPNASYCAYLNVDGHPWLGTQKRVRSRDNGVETLATSIPFVPPFDSRRTERASVVLEAADVRLLTVELRPQRVEPNTASDILRALLDSGDDMDADLRSLHDRGHDLLCTVSVFCLNANIPQRADALQSLPLYRFDEASSRWSNLRSRRIELALMPLLYEAMPSDDS